MAANKFLRRIVSFHPKDNSAAFEASKTALDQLSEAVRGSNDLFASADERLQVSSEIDQVKGLISTPIVRVAAIWDAAKNNTLLRWLAEQTASGIVRDLASKALEYLDHLLQLLKMH